MHRVDPDAVALAGEFERRRFGEVCDKYPLRFASRLDSFVKGKSARRVSIPSPAGSLDLCCSYLVINSSFDMLGMPTVRCLMSSHRIDRSTFATASSHRMK
jgi:hypothetical protein